MKLCRGTIIGSTKYKEEFFKYKEIFTILYGCEILMPTVFSQSEGYKPTEEEIEQFKIKVRENIDNSDFVFVISHNGEIGQSTGEELLYAISNKKDIRIYYF